MTGFELTALLWGAVVGGLFTFAHFCLLAEIRGNR